MRRPVQQPDERIGEPVKPKHRAGAPQRGVQRPADGHRFGRQFADDDEQVAVHEKADADGDAALRVGAGDLERAKERLEHVLEHRLDGDAQRETDQRDAELRGADVGVNVSDDVPGGFGAAMPLGGKRGELRVADAHESQFRRHEKSVQQHQRRHGQQLQAVLHEFRPVHVRASPRRR